MIGLAPRWKGRLLVHLGRVAKEEGEHRRADEGDKHGDHEAHEALAHEEREGEDAHGTANHPPIIVFEADRVAYYGAMEAWDADRDLGPLQTFLKVELVRTWTRMR